MNVKIKNKNHFHSVSEFLSTDFVIIKSDDSIIIVIQKLLQRDLNSSIVIENNVENKEIPVGIIKIKDVLRKIIGNFEKEESMTMSQLKTISAKDVMSAPLIYTFLDQPIWDALDLMSSKNISILPVLDDHDKIQGVVRMNSILKNLSEL